ncbi:tigger transposable element-derived protein 6-like protein [Elysia marginata]|uniref:Tigger transposable element-derived protein 6-like protein n=1 Tax=Elysia marginata TaxID=1093978 RepID=A0AAV4FC36_9GAST|nr:tigger transposable element-derived protein 6-like protein [Elysia marginata]
MATLYLNQEFSTWKEFFEAVELHCRKTYQPFTKVSSKSCEFSNSRLKPGQQEYPSDLGYVYFVYKCTHRGSFKSLSEGKRNVFSFKQGCKAKIYAAVDKETRSKIVVRQLNEDHCHELGPDLYQRAFLPEDERKLVDKMNKEKLLRLSQMKVTQDSEHESPKKSSGCLKRSYNQENLLEAVCKVHSGELEISKAAKVYKVPNTTLREWLVRKQVEDTLTLLTKMEENKLAVWLLEMAKTGFHLSEQSIREAVRNIFRARGPPAKCIDNWPSKKWMISFFSRYPEVALSYRNIFTTPDEPAVSKTVSPTEWFINVKGYLDALDPNLLMSADRLYAADQIFFRLTADGNKVKRCDGPRFVPGSLSSSHITLIGCASAGGHLLCPLAVFPFEEMPTYNPLEDFNDGMFQISPDGRLTSPVFLSWLKDCFIPSVAHQQKPVVLFVDTHPVHSSSVDIVDLCMQNSIILYCVDDVCARVIPPLEEPFFKHISKMWDTLAGASVVLHKEIPSQQTFGSVLKDSWTITANYDLAVEGFARSGIFPFASPERYANFSLDKQALAGPDSDPVAKDGLPSSGSSDADTDSMDHLLVTQASSEAVAAIQSVEDKSRKTKPTPIKNNKFQNPHGNQDEDKNNHSTGNLLPPTTGMVTSSQVHSAPVGTSLLNQQLPVGSYGQPVTNYFNEPLSHPPLANSSVFPLNHHQCQPTILPVQSNSLYSQMRFFSPSQNASLCYIKMLLRMAISLGEAASFDVIDKYATGQPISPAYKDMVDVLNAIVKFGDMPGPSLHSPQIYNQLPTGQPWMTQSSAEPPQCRQGALSMGVFNQSQSAQFMLNQASFDRTQAHLTQGPLNQGLASQPHANQNVADNFPDLSHKKTEMDRWREGSVSVNGTNQSSLSSQAPAQRDIQTSQSQKLYEPKVGRLSHSHDQQHYTDQSTAPVSLPVALTGKAFAVYLDVKRREIENKYGKGYGRKMPKKKNPSGAFRKMPEGPNYLEKKTKVQKVKRDKNTAKVASIPQTYKEDHNMGVAEKPNQDDFISTTAGPRDKHKDNDGLRKTK